MWCSMGIKTLSKPVHKKNELSIKEKLKDELREELKQELRREAEKQTYKLKRDIEQDYKQEIKDLRKDGNSNFKWTITSFFIVISFILGVNYNLQSQINDLKDDVNNIKIILIKLDSKIDNYFKELKRNK